MATTEHTSPAPWPPQTHEQRLHALDIATAQYALPGQCDETVWSTFANHPTPTRFWQTVNRWLDDEPVLHQLLAARPREVNRLLAARRQRRALGSVRVLGEAENW